MTTQAGILGRAEDFARPDHIGGFGTVGRIRVPSVLWAISIVVVLATLAVFAFLWLTPWVQTASGTGQVTTLSPADRAQGIAALTSGRIKQWYVRDGERVKAGDPIMEIIDVDPELINKLENERAAEASRLQAAEAATATANIDLERQRRLFDQGLTARSALESAQIRYQELLAREFEIKAQINQLAINLSRQSTQVVRAPRDGTIVQIVSGASATLVTAGQQVATIVPDTDELVVELFVTGLDAALIEPGRSVMLMFEGWPAVQAGGWPAVAVGTFRGVVQTVDPVVSSNGQFRVFVAPDRDAESWPSNRYLRFGTQARGWVLLEEVSVGYELWRRLNGFPPLQTQTQGGTGAAG
ncbi:MAG: HlyD family efflux transporter periplasmic adaptor subunit [Pseudomonadota bacterium]